MALAQGVDLSRKSIVLSLLWTFLAWFILAWGWIAVDQISSYIPSTAMATMVVFFIVVKMGDEDATMLSFLSGYRYGRGKSRPDALESIGPNAFRPLRYLGTATGALAVLWLESMRVSALDRYGRHAAHPSYLQVCWLLAAMFVGGMLGSYLFGLILGRADRTALPATEYEFGSPRSYPELWGRVLSSAALLVPCFFLTTHSIMNAATQESYSFLIPSFYGFFFSFIGTIGNVDLGEESFAIKALWPAGPRVKVWYVLAWFFGGPILWSITMLPLELQLLSRPGPVDGRLSGLLLLGDVVAFYAGSLLATIGAGWACAKWANRKGARG